MKMMKHRPTPPKPTRAGMRKNLAVTVVLLNGKRFTRRLRCEPGKLLTDAGLEETLRKEAARVEQFFPGDFHLVPLANGNFNFVEIAGASGDLHFRETRGGESENDSSGFAGTAVAGTEEPDAPQVSTQRFA